MPTLKKKQKQIDHKKPPEIIKNPNYFYLILLNQSIFIEQRHQDDGHIPEAS